MKRLFLLFFSALLCTAVSAHSFEVDGIYYYITQNSDLTVSVTYRGSSNNEYSNEYTGSVVIPEKVTYNSKEYSVTSIGYYAFYNCSGLTSVTIPNSVTSIGWYAFYGCKGLTSVTIPNSVTSIGNYTFSDCSGLTSVDIPNSVTSIGNSAFYGCSGLTSVDIPNSVTSIGESVFKNCYGLTSVTIPNSVTSIGSWAFDGCSGLTAVHITDLSAWCKIKFSSNNSNPTSYAHHLYLNGEEITNLVIPDDITSIEYGTFYGCSGLTSVTIPNSVTSIGNSAFSGCSGMASVTIPNSVTSIGDDAFEGCKGLTSVTIPNSVTSIGNYAFEGCSGMTSVDIPKSVTSIGSRAFYKCSGLAAVHISDLSSWFKIKFGNEYANPMYSSSNEVTYVNDMELTDLTIPDSITSIPEYAFRGCSSLRRVIIPESCKTVPQYAFEYCNNLQELNLPSTCVACYDYSFYGCSSLKKINCQAETPPAAYANTFSSSIYTKATLNVPEGCADKYKAANIWKEFTNMTVGGVVPDEPKQCAAPVITYADGKLQCTCETEGAKFKYMLTDTDIKTEYTDMNNGSVNLSACYTIKAYAYADGYTNSEQVTATLYWIDGSDVSTNINQTEMRGVMATCSGGIITVSGLTDGETVMFYDANGALLYTGTAQNGIISYAPSASGVIIVKIGKTSIKVVK